MRGGLADTETVAPAGLTRGMVAWAVAPPGGPGDCPELAKTANFYCKKTATDLENPSRVRRESFANWKKNLDGHFFFFGRESSTLDSSPWKKRTTAWGEGLQARRKEGSQSCRNNR
jgi:hypothetical protein